MPLSAAVWSQAVFRRPVMPTELFAAVMSDPAAALVAHGLAAMDDETLGFLADHPALVTWLYEVGAPVFATLTAHLRIHDGRVVPPGGPPPRWPDGHPDLSGHWLPNSAGQGVSGRYGVDPAAARRRL